MRSGNEAMADEFELVMLISAFGLCLSGAVFSVLF
jgi:hypothetical protein